MTMLRKQFLALLLTACLAGPGGAVQAQNEIFVCTDADGRKVYQNVGSMKGCRRLDFQPLTSVPAPRLPTPAVAPRTAAPPVTPANFPRIAADTQRVRDGERRRILEDELRAEEDRLARLRSDFNGGQPERQGDEGRNLVRYQEWVTRMQEDIARAENNIAALRRELALPR